jgi:hypothetical protein
MATVAQTIAAALALLAPVTGDAHVAADLAEANGDAIAAAELRGEPEAPDGSFRELTVDRAFVPRTLRGFSPRVILAHFYADIDDVMGVNRYGVDAEAAAFAVLGERMPLWCDILGARHEVQQALALMLIAKIREARAQSKVYRGIG